MWLFRLDAMASIDVSSQLSDSRAHRLHTRYAFSIPSQSTLARQILVRDCPKHTSSPAHRALSFCRQRQTKLASMLNHSHHASPVALCRVVVLLPCLECRYLHFRRYSFVRYPLRHVLCVCAPDSMITLATEQIVDRRPWSRSRHSILSIGLCDQRRNDSDLVRELGPITLGRARYNGTCPTDGLGNELNCSSSVYRIRLRIKLYTIRRYEHFHYSHAAPR